MELFWTAKKTFICFSDFSEIKFVLICTFFTCSFVISVAQDLFDPFIKANNRSNRVMIKGSHGCPI